MHLPPSDWIGLSQYPAGMGIQPWPTLTLLMEGGPDDGGSEVFGRIRRNSFFMAMRPAKPRASTRRADRH